MKKYYHLSTEIRKTKTFTPRIPEERLLGEDGSTKRICVCESIQDCLGAVPWSAEDLYDLKKLDKNLIPIQVYEFSGSDIGEENIVSWEELFKSGRVPDAHITKECWIVNKEIEPSNSYCIEITDFKENSTYLKSCERTIVSYEDLVYKRLDKVLYCDRLEIGYESDLEPKSVHEQIQRTILGHLPMKSFFCYTHQIPGAFVFDFKGCIPFVHSQLLKDLLSIEHVAAKYCKAVNESGISFIF